MVVGYPVPPSTVAPAAGLRAKGLSLVELLENTEGIFADGLKGAQLSDWVVCMPVDPMGCSDCAPALGPWDKALLVGMCKSSGTIHAWWLLTIDPILVRSASAFVSIELGGHGFESGFDEIVGWEIGGFPWCMPFV